MKKDFDSFCEQFNIVDNALQMRTLMRWNGRDLRERENLSEHTHLVTVCAIQLYDKLCEQSDYFVKNVNFKTMILRCLTHDSLELLRGDILSITKDTIPGLRKFTDKEEQKFMNTICGDSNKVTEDIVLLADLMACYKFVEHELRYPSNDFALTVYKTTKEKFDKHYEYVLKKYCGIKFPKAVVQCRLCKGYEADAGTDVMLDKDVTFMPMSTTTVGLNINVIPKEGEMALLCSRTSAADKGIILAMCPIDPNYNGEVMAIVHNVSNNIIEYKAGQAFCQVVTVPFNKTNSNYKTIIKRQGKRTDGKLGSTGK